jgi:hypothetical protein
MQNHGCSNALSTKLPEPTEHQDYCDNQKACNSELEKDMLKSEQDCCLVPGNTQKNGAVLNLSSKVDVNLDPKEHFFGHWRNHKHDIQTFGRAFRKAKRVSDVLQLQCTNGTEEKAQRIAEQSERTRPSLAAVRYLCLTVIVASAFVFASNSAQAALGATQSASEASIKRIGTRSYVIERHGHTVLEIVMPDGSLVQEFVSRDGVVFAVRWHTQLKPNFAKLLGTSHPAYVSALRSSLRPGIQRHFRHEGADLVIKSNSHLNVFSGLAYRRSLLPPGITPAQID